MYKATMQAVNNKRKIIKCNKIHRHIVLLFTMGVQKNHMQNRKIIEHACIVFTSYN